MTKQIEFTVEPEVLEYIKRCERDPYIKPEPYYGDYGNVVQLENRMCIPYPDPEV